MSSTFCSQTLRIKFEPSEGSMLTDLSTIVSLELIQNLQNAKSKDCLFGILNETLTPMGSRFLRSNILQPSTDAVKLNERYDALDELTLKEDMFFGVREGAWTSQISIFTSNPPAMKNFVDTDRVLASVCPFPLPDLEVMSSADPAPACHRESRGQHPANRAINQPGSDLEDLR